MSPLTYHRPQTTEEAVRLLQAGVPLAGGVSLTPQRRAIEAVIDLQDLGLDGIEVDGGQLVLGATVTLEQLFNHPSAPRALAQACRHEAPLNVRNQATIGGLVHASDGRSPLLTAMLSLHPTLAFEPDADQASLNEWLDERGKKSRRLMTSMALDLPQAMAFAAVGRSPLDRPILCAAAARLQSMESESGEVVLLALGGTGDRPVLLEAAAATGTDEGLEAVAAGAREAFASAGDEWASAEYRSDVASALARRLVSEVIH